MSGRWRCHLCQQTWYSDRGLRRHLTFAHTACRFCPRSYIRVDRHERLMHTQEYAAAIVAESDREIASERAPA